MIQCNFPAPAWLDLKTFAPQPLQQVRYEADHARRQYDAVDPGNRLVAGELERRWNDTLLAVQRLEGEIAAMAASKPPTLGDQERQRLMQLGGDLELAWSHPSATAGTRKRISRGAQRDRGAQGRRVHQHGPALAGRRSHRAPGQVEIECRRTALLAAA